jgi:hypothetical protein
MYGAVNELKTRLFVATVAGCAFALPTAAQPGPTNEAVRICSSPNVTAYIVNEVRQANLLADPSSFRIKPGSAGGRLAPDGTYICLAQVLFDDQMQANTLSAMQQSVDATGAYMRNPTPNPCAANLGPRELLECRRRTPVQTVTPQPAPSPTLAVSIRYRVEDMGTQQYVTIMR